MGTIVIDTNIVATAADRKTQPSGKSYNALKLLMLVENNAIRIGIDHERIIIREYQRHIDRDRFLQVWYKKINKDKKFEVKSIKFKGPYPSQALSKVDKALLERAVIADTRILISEDSDFYTDKSLSEPHPVVVERGVNLLKIDQAFDKIQELDP